VIIKKLLKNEELIRKNREEVHKTIIGPLIAIDPQDHLLTIELPKKIPIKDTRVTRFLYVLMKVMKLSLLPQNSKT